MQIFIWENITQNIAFLKHTYILYFSRLCHSLVRFEFRMAMSVKVTDCLVECSTL